MNETNILTKLRLAEPAIRYIGKNIFNGKIIYTPSIRIVIDDKYY